MKFLLLLLLIPFSANAAIFTWTNPTTRLDGSPLNAPIEKTIITCSETSGGPITETFESQGNGTSLVIPLGGTRYCNAITVVNGDNSPISPEVVYFLPNPPTDINVTDWKVAPKNAGDTTRPIYNEAGKKIGDALIGTPCEGVKVADARGSTRERQYVTNQDGLRGIAICQN